MKTVFTFIFFIFFTSIAWSQTKVIGKVTDAEGNVLIGANVYLEGSIDGGSSDVDGNFSFSTTLSGQQILISTYIGFEPKKIKIQIVSGENLIVPVIMPAQPKKLEAVVISAGTFGTRDGDKTELLKPLDIVTTAGAEGDIMGAMRTLPGVQKADDDGRLFVRGGEPHEMRTIIDGMSVHKAYTSKLPDLPSRGSFSPFHFKGNIFTTGGYSAEYGDAMSSVLLLNTSDLPHFNQSSVSIMSVGLGASHQQRFENSAIIGEINYINLDPLFSINKPRREFEQVPESLTGSFMYRWNRGKTGKLKLYSTVSKNRIGVKYKNIDTDEKYAINLNNFNSYINLTYSDILNDKWSYFAGMSWGMNDDFTKIGNQLERENKDWTAQAKFKLEGEITQRLSLNTGLEHYVRNYHHVYLTQDNGDLNFEDPMSVLYAETEWAVNSFFSLRTGLRSIWIHEKNEIKLAPRLASAFKLGTHSKLSFAWGKFYQRPRASDLSISTFLKSEEATHSILTYQITKEKRSFRAEIYHKAYDKLVKYEAIDKIKTYSNEGNGHAKGIDIFWRDRKTFKKVDYWLSYSYLDTKRDYRSFSQLAKPSYASAHNLSLVGKYFSQKLSTQFGATYSFTSGRPYHHPSDKNLNTRIASAAHSVNVNASYLFNMWGNNSILHMSMGNMLFRDNVYGYRYASKPDQNGNYKQEAITSNQVFNLFIGLFINFK